MIALSPGTLTVEQIYQDRDQFAKLVREVAAPDVGRMGIEILSFTIKVTCDGKAAAHFPTCPSGCLALLCLLQLPRMTPPSLPGRV